MVRIPTAEEGMFWLICDPTKAPLNERYGNERSAVVAAEMLARDNPGRPYFVLRAVSASIQVPGVATIKFTDKEQT